MIFTSKMAREQARRKHARSPGCGPTTLQAEERFFLNLPDPSSILTTNTETIEISLGTPRASAPLLRARTPHPGKCTRLVRVTHVRRHARDTTGQADTADDLLWTMYDSPRPDTRQFANFSRLFAFAQHTLSLSARAGVTLSIPSVTRPRGRFGTSPTQSLTGLNFLAGSFYPLPL